MPNRPLTVLQMIPTLESGGVERGTLELNQELVRNGHRSIVMSAGGQLVPKVIQAGGEHVTWDIHRKSLLSLTKVRPLRKFLREQQIDILHARSRIPAWIAWLAWRGMPSAQRPRFVTTAHGLYRVNLYSGIMTSGERVIAVSEIVDEHLRENYPRLDQSRLRLIPRGIDPEEFPRGFHPDEPWKRAFFQKYPQLAGRRILTMVGRITRCKGHLEFLSMLNLLRQEMPDIHGLIVGSPDPRRQGYAAEVNDTIRKLGLESHVTLTGHRSDVKEIYGLSDVVLMLTSDPPESFGRATVEALNIGTPVIGWNCGGTTEVLKAIYPQGLVPTGDIDQLKQTVQRVLIEGGTPRAEHPYLKQEMLRKTLELYEELAA